MFEYDTSIVSGDRIEFTETVFSPCWRNGRRSGVPIGERTIVCDVVRESYGEKTAQHTFTLCVAHSTGKDAPKRGSTIRRKGRTIYRDFRIISRAPDYIDRARSKHARGQLARERKALGL